MKLKQQFGLIATLLIIIVIAGISTAFFVYEKKLLIRQMKENEMNIFESFVEMSNEALILHDELLLLNYINLIKKINSNVVYMLFMNNDGYVLSAPHQLADYVPVNGIQKREASLYYTSSGKEIFDMAEPVTVNSERLGVARIGFSQDILKAEVEKSLRKTGKRILIIAVLTLVLGIIGAILLANSMTRPINKVIAGAKSIGEGNLEHKIDIKSRSELGDMAQEFNRMALKLKELDDMKDHFISSVSHELKSPLYHIKGHIDLFLMENKNKISGEAIQQFNVIKNNIKRLSNFISDILDMAMIKSRRMMINRKECDISGITEETLSFYRTSAEEKGIRLEADIPKDLSRAYCDTEKIAQVLHNLLGNAFKFTPKGGVIGIAASEKQDKIEVCVYDTGVGIPESGLSTIFEKFSQVKENLDKVDNVKGTGLGLAIVKGIIEAHDEEIRVESELDKGSRFIFTLAKMDKAAVAGLAGPGVTAGSKVLLIDDDEKTLEMVSGFLSREGYLVRYSVEGTKAVRLAEDFGPDIIIVDLMMPHMDGFEVIKKLKENEKTRNIPVIVLSSSIDGKNRKKCMALGASDCLEKSSFEGIKDMIERHIN
ncbi:MAG: hybrid sensor histidine kinase/response regulator [Elusimicrobia bacterium]|nr:hybrid sensor histidine kinase/response regulator [Elusimicrobiota bacterium]